MSACGVVAGRWVSAGEVLRVVRLMAEAFLWQRAAGGCVLLRGGAMRAAADGRERSLEGQPAVCAAAGENNRSLALFPDDGQVYTPRRECSARRPLVCGLWGPWLRSPRCPWGAGAIASLCVES